LTLSPESAERIALLYRVAKRNGSLISLKELRSLLGENTTETDVEEAIGSIPALSSKFELRAGYLLERHERAETPELESRSRMTATNNLTYAGCFSSYLHTTPFAMIAVSGSTSYGSASRSKDVDLFCVSPKGRMWIALTKGLLMARGFAMAHSGAPPICFSCIMDEGYARSAFAMRRDPLFARDALQTKVARGEGLYQSLMSSAGWISRLYPVAYRTTVTRIGIDQPRPGPSALANLLDRLLYLIVGRYLKLKSNLLNRRLSAIGRNGDVFDVDCAEDHLIYESRRYSALRQEYMEVLSGWSPFQPR
jgi:hypothetical protein